MDTLSYFIIFYTTIMLLSGISLTKNGKKIDLSPIKSSILVIVLLLYIQYESKSFFQFFKNIDNDNILKSYINYNILYILLLSLGISMYIGAFTVIRKKYKFLAQPIDSKTFFVLLGSVPLILIIFSYAQIFIPNSSNLLFYILEMHFLVFLIGIEYANLSIPKKIVTLKLINGDELKDLEIYQKTSVEYCFIDSDGKDFTIPIGQIQKIENQNIHKEKK